MEITEVRVALREGGEKRLKAYATLTFDACFVVRNVKVIEGKNGLFVAMPSHKPKVACGGCRFKNDLGGRFCSQCGAALPQQPVARAPAAGELEPADMLAHRDIAHPITVEFRQYLQRKVLEAYEAERAKVRPNSPGGIDAEQEAEGV
jgi:stage V sporulation protein G